jgi:hypothetical protein
VTIFFYERTRTNKTCVLAQITINKVQYVLAQITTNNFFYEKTKTKMRCELAQITINKEKRCVNTNYKKQFFLSKDKDKNVLCVSTF